MSDYIRARSDEHKEERLSQIKEATAELFATVLIQKLRLQLLQKNLAGLVQTFINTLRPKWRRKNRQKYL